MTRWINTKSGDILAIHLFKKRFKFYTYYVVEYRDGKPIWGPVRGLKIKGVKGEKKP